MLNRFKNVGSPSKTAESLSEFGGPATYQEEQLQTAMNSPINWASF